MSMPQQHEYRLDNASMSRNERQYSRGCVPAATCGCRRRYLRSPVTGHVQCGVGDLLSVFGMTTNMVLSIFDSEKDSEKGTSLILWKFSWPAGAVKGELKPKPRRSPSHPTFGTERAASLMHVRTASSCSSFNPRLTRATRSSATASGTGTRTDYGYLDNLPRSAGLVTGGLSCGLRLLVFRFVFARFPGQFVQVDRQTLGPLQLHRRRGVLVKSLLRMSGIVHRGHIDCKGLKRGRS